MPQGTGKGFYGYTYSVQTGQREVVEDQAAVVRETFQEFAAGVGCSRIARGLNERAVPSFGGGRWHPLTVRRMLRNETYTGRTIYRRTRAESVNGRRGGKKRRRVITQPQQQWIEVPGATPPLISKEIFERAQAILEDPARRLRGRPTHQYRLRGHLRCISCGTPMVGQSHKGGRYRYYRCRKAYAGYFEGKCDSKYVRVETLERVVLEQLATLLSDPRRILEEAGRHYEAESHPARLRGIERKLGDVEESQRRLARLYLGGSLPEELLNSESGRLNREGSGLESERRTIEAEASRSIDLEGLASRLPEMAARLHRWIVEATDKDVELIAAALDLQVKASAERVLIEGTVPALEAEAIDLVTIVQTSG